MPLAGLPGVFCGQALPAAIGPAFWVEVQPDDPIGGSTAAIGGSALPIGGSFGGSCLPNGESNRLIGGSSQPRDSSPTAAGSAVSAGHRAPGFAARR